MLVFLAQNMHSYRITSNNSRPLIIPASTKNRKNMPKFFCSKFAEMKILFCNVGMGIKLNETKIFDLWSEKIELMK